MTAEPKGEPIWIPCEGSDQPGYFVGTDLYICAMCGDIVECADDGTVGTHNRDDILARLNRGDYE